MTLYKVLMNGQSCHGGQMKWSLPRGARPGRWHKLTEGDPLIGQRGFHLTAEPWDWWKWGAEVYEAEGRRFGLASAGPHKVVCAQARLLRPTPKPDWLVRVEEFVASLPDLAWFKLDGKPRGSWRLFTAPTRAAARDAARYAARDAARYAARDAARASAWDAIRDATWYASRNAARNAARAATWDAAWDAALYAAWAATWDATWDDARDAALYAGCLVSEITGPHREHAEARMEVWRKGYGLACDVAGVLYVYAAAPASEERKP